MVTYVNTKLNKLVPFLSDECSHFSGFARSFLFEIPVHLHSAADFMCSQWGFLPVL